MNLLLDSRPLVILPELAVAVGLKEAIILQQVHYWIQKSDKEYDGHIWTYNSIPKWAEQFPFWSVDTVKRTFKRLEEKGLLVSSNHNNSKFDRTKWYRIGYDVLDAIVPNASGQFAPMDPLSLPPPIPETSSETSSLLSIDAVETEHSERPKNHKKWTEQQFIDSVYESNNPPVLSPAGVQAFINHFTEPSPSGKMKFQFPQTWSTKGRMSTWAKNNYSGKDAHVPPSSSPGLVGDSPEPQEYITTAQIDFDLSDVPQTEGG